MRTDSQVAGRTQRDNAVVMSAASPVMRVVAATLAALMALYLLLPIYWMVVASTKTSGGVVGSPGLAPSSHLHLLGNLASLFSYQNHIFITWALNSLLYAGIGGVAATGISMAAGYALAIYSFPGKKILIGLIVVTSAIPAATLALPLYLLISHMGLANSRIGVLLPLCVSSFGVFLLWLFFDNSDLSTVVEAARVDGAGEFRILWRIGAPVAAPAVVTAFLLTFVATFNNYLLPLLLLSSPDKQPLTVGLANWASVGQGGSGSGTQLLYTLVVTGTLVTIIPILALFLLLQRYWRNGLAVGSVTG